MFEIYPTSSNDLGQAVWNVHRERDLRELKRLLGEDEADEEIDGQHQYDASGEDATEASDEDTHLSGDDVVSENEYHH